MDLVALNEQFAIPGILAFDEPHPGMHRARITSKVCIAELYLQGAHLAAWQPAGQQPVLFLSSRSDFASGKPIRGGVPVIFPWFAARSPEITGNVPRPDPSAKSISHGFARLQPWTVAFAAQSGEDVHLTLTLAPSNDSRAAGFDHFRVAFELTVGRSLTMRLAVANQGETPLKFEEALHTYYAVGDVTQARVHGLDGVDYLDKVDHFTRKHQTGDITFGKETDRPYLNTAATCTLFDSSLHRRITIAKYHSQTTVVWNIGADGIARIPDLAPDEWQKYACVETANAGESAITLEPKSAHTMEARITVEPV